MRVTRVVTTRSAMCLLVSTCFLGGVGCKKTAASDADKPVVAVEAVHPQNAAITEQIDADAVLAPIAQAAIQTKFTAPIRKFYVQRGSRVKAGQLLATLENKDLAAAALDNQGTYKAAQGAYTAATQLTVPQEETQARVDVQQAKATLDLQQSILKARTQLFAQGASPGRDVDTARASELQAQAAYEIANQKYQAVQKVGRTASIETAQGNLASAKGKLLGAEAQLSYTEVRTPIKGVVTERPLFAGETATTGTPVLTVMDTSTMIAKLHIAQRQAQQLQLGSAAKVTVPGVDEPLDAKVSLISPALDVGSTTVEVWLQVPNGKAALRAGTAVHVVIQGKTLHGLTIPEEAVQRSSEGAGKTVMVIAADGTAHKRSVEVGVETKESAQVLSGLVPGDLVITAGGYGLDDGTKVKVEAAKPDAGDATDKPSAAGEKE